MIPLVAPRSLQSRVHHFSTLFHGSPDDTRTGQPSSGQSKKDNDCCNTCLVDSPLGVGGRSARQRPDICLDGCGTHISFLCSSSLRPEPSGARALAPSSPPSVDLPLPATKSRFLAREPSPAPPLPSQTPSPASPRPESPNHRRSEWEALEALLHRRSVSPVVLRSN